MTNETSTPDSLEARIDEAPANTTVFSDGSTFDYENGYQSNGAPVATRDRTDNPKIVKSHKVLTLPRVMGSLLVVVLLLTLFVAAVSGIQSFQKADNVNAIKAGINESGQVKVVQLSDGDLLAKRPDGSVFKCAVSYASNEGNPTGFVFCSPGAPATFSIPLPHDPNNPFYNVPIGNLEK
jgi:hypothetical protein